MMSQARGGHPRGDTPDNDLLELDRPGSFFFFLRQWQERLDRVSPQPSPTPISPTEPVRFSTSFVPMSSEAEIAGTKTSVT